MTAPGSLATLEDLLKARIDQSGPISVADYMAAALFEPGLGYYVTRDPLGRGGDFITAPEISQVFGELVGLWCAQVWETMGSPDGVHLVELGPGRGTLMADALIAVRKASPLFARALDLHLVEGSPPLRARQEETLAGRIDPERLTWHSDISEVPPGPALIVANEFVDVLPVEQFVRVPDGWRRRRVGIDRDRTLVFVPGELSDPGLPETLEDAPLGSVFERCPAGEGLAAIVAARVVADGGAAVLIDYGHAPSGLGDTLQAVRGHRRWPVLAEPGTADLTHHVDFQAMRRAAESVGGRVFGPLPQGLFLGRLGIEERARILAADKGAFLSEDVMAGVWRLIHPRRMGLLFKVLTIGDPRLPTPPGF